MLMLTFNDDSTGGTNFIVGQLWALINTSSGSGDSPEWRTFSAGDYMTDMSNQTASYMYIY